MENKEKSSIYMSTNPLQKPLNFELGATPTQKIIYIISSIHYNFFMTGKGKGTLQD